jgi:thiamine biosynthesis lipoprotein
MRSTVWWLSSFIFVSGISFAGDPVTFKFPAIGTEIGITYFPAPKTDPKQVEARVREMFQELDAQASLYRTDSRLSALNAAEPDTKIAISPMLCKLLKEGIRMTRESEGRFDITYKRPAIDAVKSDCAEGGLTAGHAWLAKKGVYVDLNGIAAGFIADDIGAFFNSQGIQDFMIDTGGELLACGSRAGKPWRIGIDDPSQSGAQVLKVIEVPKGKCLGSSTSGDYNRSLVKNGENVSFIVDPKTGKPVKDVRMVSVFGRNATEADALSTGLSSGIQDRAYVGRMKKKFGLRVFAVTGPQPSHGKPKLIEY